MKTAADLDLFKDRHVVLGVTGGIAAYKSCELVSRLIKAGASVQVVMTEAATKFVGPLTFQTLSNSPVITDLFSQHSNWNVAHVSVADAADLMVVAPATANLIAKYRTGIANDFLSTSLLATRAPVILAPAMNVNMYEHPAVRENLSILAERGVHLVEPGSGRLACGVTGKGRMAEVEQILDKMLQVLTSKTAKDFLGKKILITAGGTREPIDPVRFISNRSSGKMGYALAKEAVLRGAQVVLVSTPVGLAAPKGCELVMVETAQQMYEAVVERSAKMDIIIKAAAVADYRVKEAAEQKMKKTDEGLTLELVKNPDILAVLGDRKPDGQILVGFAAETHNMDAYALDKLIRKKADLLVANNVTLEGAGFGSDTNIVTIFKAKGEPVSLGLLPKNEVAKRILDEILIN